MKDTEDGAERIPFPKQAFFILGGYLTERFVYYGLFGGSVFYYQRVLGFSAADSSTIKSILESFIYFAPIIGAILSDTYLGKVKTVLVMCCAYICGAIIFTLSSMTPIMTNATLIKAVGIGGTLFLGISAGLMKAVYTSLGPDQFVLPQQRRQQQSYFSAFYWMINAGAFCGQLLTAQLRQNVQCFNDDCYALPFSILCVLMCISLGIFAAGRKKYTESPPDPTLLNVIKCICISIKEFFKSDKKPVEHWIDRAAYKFSPELIEAVKTTLRVLLLFVTYPLFWAIFYQSSTGMIFLAKRLDDYVGNSRIPAELTSSINPLLILILIPIFEKVIYPVLAKFNLFQRTTTRMATGMLFSAFSFIIYAFVSANTEQKILSSTEARVQIYKLNDNCVFDIEQAGLVVIDETDANISIMDYEFINKDFSITMKYSCNQNENKNVNVTLAPGKMTTIIFLDDLLELNPTDHYIKNQDAEAKVRVVDLSQEHDSVILRYEQFQQEFKIQNWVSNFETISPQMYDVIATGVSYGNAHIRQDGVYDIILYKDSTDNSKSTVALALPVTAPTTLHSMIMIPQYLVLTIGEILFSVSSMDFAYEQAPKSMKSVLQAANLFTITIGLWIYAGFNVMNSASGVFKYRPSYEAIMYAILMVVNTVIFILLVKRFYNQTKSDTEIKMKEKEKEAMKGIDNPSYE